VRYDGGWRMTAWQMVAAIVRIVGWVCVVPGLFFAANGVRTVVSGRIDERKSSRRALRIGLPLLTLGLILVFGGTWLANWAVQ
jgi:succinate dehydrogenase/fumarate reductase cytochrome b subunit